MVPLLEESKKRFGGQLLYASSGPFGKRNKRSIENVELSIQRLKYLFLCNLLTWTKLFIDERLMSIVDFIDRFEIGLRKGVAFCFLFLFLVLFGCHCIHHVYFDAPFLVLFSTNLIY